MLVVCIFASVASSIWHVHDSCRFPVGKSYDAFESNSDH